MRRTLLNVLTLGLAMTLAVPPMARAQGPAGSDPGAKLDALNAALDSGLITAGEYRARVEALTQAAPPAPPGAQGSAPGNARGNTQFQSVDGDGGGQILLGQLGSQPSADEAAAAALRYLHGSFGVRPAVTQMARNEASGSAVLFFTAAAAGQPRTGMAVLNGVPGSRATAAILYDMSQHFPLSVGPMLRQLQTLTGPPAGPAQLAPPEPMQRHMFPDGTGSIDLPASWRLLNGGGGTTAALGPTGELVAYNVVLTGMDPNNPKAAMYLRTMPPQVLESRKHSMVVLPYISDPIQAYLSAYRGLARQNGKPPPELTVRRSSPIGGEQGLRAAEIEGDGTLPGFPGKADDAPGEFFGFVQVTAPDLMGQWTLYSTLMFVPRTAIPRQGETALAVLGSVRINFQAVAAISAATRATFQKQFESMIASARAQDAARAEQGRRFLEMDREHQEQMQRQTTAMRNYVLDQQVVVNTGTGVHSTIDSGLAGALVRDDPNYQLVPPSRLLRGVDY